MTRHNDRKSGRRLLALGLVALIGGPGLLSDPAWAQEPKAEPAKPAAKAPAKPAPKAAEHKTPEHKPAAAAPAPKPDAAATYRKAMEKADTGDGAGARAMVAGLGDPLLDKVVRWLDYTKGKGPLPFAEVARFINDNPDWPNQTLMRRRAEEQMGSEPNDQAILAFFKDQQPISREGRLRQVDALYAVGRAADALTILRRVWVEDVFTAPDEKAFLDRYAPPVLPEDEVAKLDRLLWRGPVDAAKRQMLRVDDANRLLADARIQLSQQSPTAMDALRAVPADKRNDPGLIYERIRYARRQGNDGEARALLLDAPPPVARPELWWDEREIQIRRALAEGDFALAYRLASRHRFANGGEMADAEFMSGFIALRMQKDPQTAIGHFQTMAGFVKFPWVQSRAYYWLGRALDAAGRRPEAQEAFAKAAAQGTTFYGQLATSLLDNNTMIRLPAEPPIIAADAHRFDQREIVRVSKRLSAIGATDRLDSFIWRLGDSATNAEEARLAADLGGKLGRLDLGVRVARRVHRDGIVLVDTGFPRLPFPMQDAPEQALVYGLIRQESGFQVDVVSKAGARGLMQLMPATAKGVAGKLGLPYADRRLTTEPTYNLTLGQAYLGQVLDTFNGSYALALAAYNAGPGRVRQWLRDIGDPRTGEIDMIDWMERIPFSETRGYVQRVLEGLQVYRAQLGNRAIQTAAAADSSPILSSWCMFSCYPPANTARAPAAGIPD